MLVRKNSKISILHPDYDPPWSHPPIICEEQDRIHEEECICRLPCWNRQGWCCLGKGEVSQLQNTVTQIVLKEIKFWLSCEKLMIYGFSSHFIKNETLNSYFILFILYSTVDKAYDMYLNNFLRRQIRQKWRRLSSVGGLHKYESCGCRQLHKGKRS